MVGGIGPSSGPSYAGSPNLTPAEVRNLLQSIITILQKDPRSPQDIDALDADLKKLSAANPTLGGNLAETILQIFDHKGSDYQLTKADWSSIGGPMSAIANYYGVLEPGFEGS